MKVTLVFPGHNYVTGDPPLGIGYIASYIRQQIPEIKISILDTTFNHKLSYVRDFFDYEKPDIIGIYIDTIGKIIQIPKR